MTYQDDIQRAKVLYRQGKDLQARGILERHRGDPLVEKMLEAISTRLNDTNQKRRNSSLNAGIVLQILQFSILVMIFAVLLLNTTTSSNSSSVAVQSTGNFREMRDLLVDLDKQARDNPGTIIYIDYFNPAEDASVAQRREDNQQGNYSFLWINYDPSSDNDKLEEIGSDFACFDQVGTDVVMCLPFSNILVVDLRP